MTCSRDKRSDMTAMGALKFKDRMRRLEADLQELAVPKSAAGENDLRLLVSKHVQHYEKYAEERASMAKKDAPSLLCARWCSSFESSFLWIGGCRPTMAVRLLYALSGRELELHLEEFLRGEKTLENDLTAGQMGMVNALHLRTVREEDALSSRLASLQEELADKPFVSFRLGCTALDEDDINRAMARYEESLGRIVQLADGLRLETLRELVRILSPAQAVDYLIATKQLELSLHRWCSRRDCGGFSPTHSYAASQDSDGEGGWEERERKGLSYFWNNCRNICYVLACLCECSPRLELQAHRRIFALVNKSISRRKPSENFLPSFSLNPPLKKYHGKSPLRLLGIRSSSHESEASTDGNHMNGKLSSRALQKWTKLFRR